jgi:TPR repeat protein
VFKIEIEDGRGLWSDVCCADGSELFEQDAMKILVTAVSLCGLACAVDAWAGYPEAMAAYGRGDYAAAYQQFSELAKQGDTDALLGMAALSEPSCGLGKPPDSDNELICKAAEANNVHAKFLVAASVAWAAPICGKTAIPEGQVSESSRRKAHAEFEAEYRTLAFASAAHGNPLAMLWSAQYYERLSAPPDLVRAYAWYALTAKRLPRDAPIDDAERVAKQLSADERLRASELFEKLDRDTPIAGLIVGEPCPVKRR